jgi:hypothetical protein
MKSTKEFILVLRESYITSNFITAKGRAKTSKLLEKVQIFTENAVESYRNASQLILDAIEVRVENGKVVEVYDTSGLKALAKRKYELNKRQRAKDKIVDELYKLVKTSV